MLQPNGRKQLAQWREVDPPPRIDGGQLDIGFALPAIYFEHPLRWKLFKHIPIQPDPLYIWLPAKKNKHHDIVGIIVPYLSSNTARGRPNILPHVCGGTKKC